MVTAVGNASSGCHVCMAAVTQSLDWYISGFDIPQGMRWGCIYSPKSPHLCVSKGAQYCFRTATTAIYAKLTSTGHATQPYMTAWELGVIVCSGSCQDAINVWTTAGILPIQGHLVRQFLAWLHATTCGTTSLLAGWLAVHSSHVAQNVQLQADALMLCS